MDELVTIAKSHRLFLLEDCAEAFGTYYKGKHVGTFGDISTFSFYGNKTITTGEGGMVVTNDETLYQRSIHLKGQGLAKYREYWHDVIGYNYRMTNICAAIGLAQLEQADSFIKRKRDIASLYNQCLEGTGYVSHAESVNTQHSYWMYSILTPTVQQRDFVREFLKERAIETRPTFYPVHTIPMYSQKFERHAVAESIALRGINLPSYPTLLDEQVTYIAQSLKDALTHYNMIHTVRHFAPAKSEDKSIVKHEAANSISKLVPSATSNPTT